MFLCHSLWHTCLDKFTLFPKKVLEEDTPCMVIRLRVKENGPSPFFASLSLPSPSGSNTVEAAKIGSESLILETCFLLNLVQMLL